MIYMTETLHDMLAAFAAASDPITMADAARAVPTAEPSDDAWAPTHRPRFRRVLDLMQAGLELDCQGCIRLAAEVDGMLADTYEITDVGRRIATSRTVPRTVSLTDRPVRSSKP